ncbi:ABC transporter substrate-binding protein [Hwanghaeella grinnelliae]|nr:ABC transporter substrate-binding protein [Hwanghaeella grinnelliae]
MADLLPSSVGMPFRYLPKCYNGALDYYDFSRDSVFPRKNDPLEQFVTLPIWCSGFSALGARVPLWGDGLFVGIDMSPARFLCFGGCLRGFSMQVALLSRIFIAFGVLAAFGAIDAGAFAGGCTSPTVVMIVPDHEENTFWGPYTRFTRAAAADLGIDLRLVFAEPNDRFDYLERFIEVQAAYPPADYVAVFAYFAGLPQVLELAQRTGNKVVTFNSGISDTDRVIVGTPRTRFSNWILHSQAADLEAGRLQASAIVGRARKMFGLSKTETVRVTALGGNLTTGASLERRDGLAAFFSAGDLPETVNQFVFANWDYERGFYTAKGLFQRYPETHAVWTASFDLGRAAIDAWRAVRPGKPLPIVGTISGGWDARAFEMMERKELDVVLGGHFSEGAWLMALIQDYDSGLDFIDEVGTELYFPLELAGPGNFERIRETFRVRDWDRIDFKRLSKCHRPLLERYDFSLRNLLR